jgi:hypothetical protein
MSSSIVTYNNLAQSKFDYSKPRANPGGGTVINLFAKNSKEWFTFSTPLMFTWGASEGTSQETGNPNGKWSASLQFPSDSFPDENGSTFLAGLRELEHTIKTDAMEHSMDWFGTEIDSMAVMNVMCNSMIYQPKVKGTKTPDLTKAPTFSVKIPNWKSKGWQTEVYDEDGKPLFLKSYNSRIENGENLPSSPLEFIKPQCRMMCLIQSAGIWIVNGKMSITWNFKQILVKTPEIPEIVEGVCFMTPTASEREQLSVDTGDSECINNSEVSVTEPETQGCVVVDDSDEENSDEESEKPPVLSSTEKKAAKKASAAAKKPSAAAKKAAK